MQYALLRVVNLTDDVTTCPMMTSLCVIELIMLSLV